MMKKVRRGKLIWVKGVFGHEGMKMGTGPVRRTHHLLQPDPGVSNSLVTGLHEDWYIFAKFKKNGTENNVNPIGQLILKNLVI